ncbi:YggT family protein [Novosphingobium sp. B 225]|uniref:YggT family protein n=1 Tax=Novosphingobium sp. B 225 TaxID=1961849 RepID=UPI0020CDF977|nr:YggT family protein [Novosphingobium sp. B 225]
MISQVLIPILMLLMDVVTTVVIVQFVLYLLIQFNVVSMHSPFVSALWQGLNAILDPLLNPIRRMLPHTGALDFSPLVLIVLMRIVLIILSYLGSAAYQ